MAAHMQASAEAMGDKKMSSKSAQGMFDELRLGSRNSGNNANSGRSSRYSGGEAADVDDSGGDGKRWFDPDGPEFGQRSIEAMDEVDVEAIKTTTARLEDRTTITRTIEITTTKTTTNCLNTWRR